jgi:hypothetical protein
MKQTGLGFRSRRSSQCSSPIPEFGTSIFVIPRDFVKNALDRYVVLNRIARSVVNECRGRHSEFVFTRNGNPLTRIYNSGWKGARRRASARYEKEFGRPCPAGFRSIRVHDLTPGVTDCGSPASASRTASFSSAIKPST